MVGFFAYFSVNLGPESIKALNRLFPHACIHVLFLIGTGARVGVRKTILFANIYG